MVDFLCHHHRIWVLTGAGISQGSGIPTYRDHDGSWQRSDPIQHQEFVSDRYSRQRYWARSMAGWQYIEQAQPNSAHMAVTTLQQQGRISGLVTQNVDGLHQAAGSPGVIDLHGNLHRIICLDCNVVSDRRDYQQRLVADNPALARMDAETLPDGDADVEDRIAGSFVVPPCLDCGGVLKPDVVFFGGSADPEIVRQSFAALRQSDAMLVVGSSLQVYSGFRFCRKAAESGIPIAAINIGKTRADDLLTVKLRADCCEVMPLLLEEDQLFAGAR